MVSVFSFVVSASVAFCFLERGGSVSRVQIVYLMSDDFQYREALFGTKL